MINVRSDEESAIRPYCASMTSCASRASYLSKLEVRFVPRWNEAVAVLIFVFYKLIKHFVPVVVYSFGPEAPDEAKFVELEFPFQRESFRCRWNCRIMYQ